VSAPQERVSLPFPHVAKGKVRDLYEIAPDRTLLVASDRISVFDVVLEDEIPDKGRVLTALATFWFERTASITPNHFISADPSDFESIPEVAGRAMVVRTAVPIRLECIARGYLFGGAWASYRETGTVHGRSLRPGLREAERLPEPIFTPTTKSETGHDRPLSDDDAVALVGVEVFERLRDATLAIYGHGASHAESVGILLADTKLEFGYVDDELVLIDEVLTPDSSRYWPADRYAPGVSPPSFDKQYVRDHYLDVGWDQRPPAPPVPPDVVDGTRARYVEAYERLTGCPFSDWYG